MRNFSERPRHPPAHKQWRRHALATRDITFFRRSVRAQFPEQMRLSRPQPNPADDVTD